VIPSLSSFFPVNTFPLKIIADRYLIESILIDDKLIPRHLQLAPTNRCNLQCSFCSCRSIDRSEELTHRQLREIVEVARRLGVRGITLTGGGEPTLHPNICDLIYDIAFTGMSIGIVSNGLNWVSIPRSVLQKVTWARTSFSDSRTFDKLFLQNMDHLLGAEIDMGFSYVLTKTPSIHNLAKIIDYANSAHFQYIRIVDDLMNMDSDVSNARSLIRSLGIDDRLVAYQDRHNVSRQGATECYISLVKPFIYPDGWVYPCCATNISIRGQEGTLPKQARMGPYTALPQLIERQQWFNGALCGRCDYWMYNECLALIKECRTVKHKDFI